jgi:Phosphate-selective porin O and P
MSFHNLRWCVSRLVTGSVCAALFHVAVSTAGVAQQGSDIEQLRRELAEHRKYIESLEKRLEAQETKAAAKEKEPALISGDTTTNVTVDLGFRSGGFTLQGAGYYRHDNFTTAGLKNGNDWGYYSQAGYYLIPQKLEATARISGVEFDTLNVTGVFRKTTAYSAGLNYYIHGHNLKFQTDYSFLDNDSFSGQPRARDSHRFRFQTQFLF